MSKKGQIINYILHTTYYILHIIYIIYYGLKFMTKSFLTIQYHIIYYIKYYIKYDIKCDIKK